MKRTLCRLAGPLTLSSLLACSTTVQADCTDLESYYEAASAAESSEELRSSLHGIISANYVRIPYDQLWDKFVETDTAFSDDDPPVAEVRLIYTQRKASESAKLSGKIPEAGDWNREHTWPQSRGLGVKSTPQYSDLNHIRPADYKANSARGNKNFGPASNAVNGSAGVPAGKESSNTFEPKDQVKGDVARMLFYMEVRYPHLRLIKGDAPEGSKKPEMGQLCTLLKWHEADAVSDAEALRNVAVCGLQKNRNPFIDHPEWVSVIWGASCS
ncbi:endonuclease [Pelagibius sp. CAU 1746]|uniref:endonuclease I family protein n=1 Tax=Pelagibius sp. CAU 1746 TaxID=3140370 RepID=UPI00325B2CA2